MSNFDNPEAKPSLKRLHIPGGEMNEPDTLITPQVNTFLSGLNFLFIPIHYIIHALF